MWEMVSNMVPAARMMGRRNRGMNTATAMLVGAGIGIAAWEIMRRNNAMGNLRSNMNVNNQGMGEMAEEVLNAIK